MLLFGNNATLKALSRAFEMLKWTVMGLLTAPHSPQLGWCMEPYTTDEYGCST